MDYKQGNEEVMELKLNKPTKQKIQENLCFSSAASEEGECLVVPVYCSKNMSSLARQRGRVELIRVYGLVLSNLWSDYHGYIGC